jgi:hypothetical protein
MKIKDEADAQTFTAYLNRVVVCADKKGREVSSFVVERIEAGSAADSSVASTKRPTPTAAIMLAALRYALVEVGEIPPASNHIPSRTKCVSVDQWRTYADMRSNLEKPDSKLKAFVRGSEWLQAGD